MSQNPAAPPKPKTQKELLKEAKYEVKKQSFLLKRHWKNDDIISALKAACTMCSELRTTKLEPDTYYDLFVFVSAQLATLGEKLSEKYTTPSNELGQLYDVVQYCGNVLPRMYVLITVGSVLISTKTAAVQDVMEDLLIMARGVQHPMRGLFLRSYLTSTLKDKFPDSSNQYENQDATIQNTITFIRTNFIEMNRLWVRLQHSGSHKSIVKRTLIREKLKLLVGTNLDRLSKLEGIDLDMYALDVLPNVLTQIIDCHDSLAQFYLLECIIAVFPDEFHLNTLGPLLNALMSCEESVDVRGLLVNLCDRLIKFAVSNPNRIPEDDLAVFPIMFSHISKFFLPHSINVPNPEDPENPSQVVKKPAIKTFESAIDCIKQLFLILQAFVPTRVDFCNHILNLVFKVTNYHIAKEADDYITSVTIPPAETEDQIAYISKDENDAYQTLYELINLVAVHFASPIGALVHLSQLGPLLDILPLARRRRVCSNLLIAFYEAGKPIQKVDDLKQLLRIIRPLLKDYPGLTPSGEPDPALVPVPREYLTSSSRQLTPGKQLPSRFRNQSRFEYEQQLLAQLVHHVGGPGQTDLQFQLLHLLSKIFFQGGALRMNYTLPALVIAILKLAVDVRKYIAQIQRMHKVAVQEAAAAGKDPPAPPTDRIPQISSKRIFQLVHSILSRVYHDELLDAEGEEVPSIGSASPTSLTGVEPMFIRRNGHFDINHLDDEDLFATFAPSQIQNPPQPAPLFNWRRVLFGLFLQAAQSAALCRFEKISHEFLFTFAYQCYDQILDPKIRIETLQVLLGSLVWIRWTEKDQRNSHTSAAISHVGRISSKLSICHSFLNLAHAFHQPAFDNANESLTCLGRGDPVDRQPKHVYACLKRGISAAKSISTFDPKSSFELTLDLLNSFAYFTSEKVESINPQEVNQIVQLVKAQQSSLAESTEEVTPVSTTSSEQTGDSDLFGEEGDEFLAAGAHKKKKKTGTTMTTEQLFTYYNNTMEYLALLKKDPETSQSFQSIIV